MGIAVHTVALDLFDRILGAPATAKVVDHYIRALPGQSFRHGKADTTRSARHKGNLAFQIHAVSPIERAVILVLQTSYPPAWLSMSSARALRSIGENAVAKTLE